MIDWRLVCGFAAAALIVGAFGGMILASVLYANHRSRLMDELRAARLELERAKRRRIDVLA